jgi:glutamyl-tRNA reductase
MDIKEFHIAGINYRKSDAAMRGLFAVSQQQYQSVLEMAAQKNISEVFILSTCNRTEIYGVANTANDLIDLLCGKTAGSKNDFIENAYIKSGWHAVEHLFNVGAGLDSQILGDYEIVGQVKQAIKFSKQNNCTGPFLERLVNTVLQSSKAVKAETELSGGTVSVSYAAIQYLKENLIDPENKNIVLAGAGKIGSSTCRNLVDYLDAKNITLVNRTDDKAKELAKELGVNFFPYQNTKKLFQNADVIIVATNADAPVLLKDDISSSGSKILIDLSIPNNIDTAVKDLPGVRLINVDDLSKINDKTLQKRIEEVPKAKQIIVKHIHEFVDWCLMRRNVPALKAVKQKMLDMQQCPVIAASNSTGKYSFSFDEENMQQIINDMAAKMRTQHKPGCHYIQALNDFISASAV